MHDNNYSYCSEKNNIDVSKTSANVKKIMGANPRTISDIVIEIKMSKDLAQKDRIRLEKAALHAQSIKVCTLYEKGDNIYIYLNVMIYIS